MGNARRLPQRARIAGGHHACGVPRWVRFLLDRRCLGCFTQPCSTLLSLRIHFDMDTAMKLPSLLLLAVCATAASAAAAATRDEQTKACKHDAIKFCATHIPNKAKIEACMKEHYDKLSPKCQAMFDPPGNDKGNDSDSQSSS
jgi:hypothetical protein